MPVAFAKFDEPHAWLIRGLVEYGWTDLSPVGGRIPSGRPGGMELVRFRDSAAREGVHLLMTAQAGGQICSEDGVYDFAVYCYRRDDQWTVGVRCAEANFLQEFPFDPANPTWVAGYVHQAVTAYVPQYVGWRLQGGELSWAQRKGLPELEGEACSPGLARFVDEMVRMRRGMDAGPAEGWWMGLDSPPPPVGHGPAPSAPGGAPAAFSGGPIAVAGKAGGPAGASSVDRALRKAKPAGRAMVGTSSVLLLIGLVSLFNALLTVVLFLADRPAALGGSLCFGLLLAAGGGIGIAGGRKLAAVQKSVLPWMAVAANLALPPLLLVLLLTIDIACCAAAGPIALAVPVALYSLYILVDGDVSKTRRELAGR